MTFFCLLRGCRWRSTLTAELAGFHCQCCERCGALRYRRPGEPFDRS
ncbi:PSPA7_2676 family Cys-rich small protein [Pseudomonas entomophila]